MEEAVLCFESPSISFLGKRQCRSVRMPDSLAYSFEVDEVEDSAHANLLKQKPEEQHGSIVQLSKEVLPMHWFEV
jgi:hypothetical protein